MTPPSAAGGRAEGSTSAPRPPWLADPNPAWVASLGPDLEAAVPALREHLPVTRRSIYMNTGSSGPTPAPALEAVFDYHRWVNEVGPGGYPGILGMESVERELREALGGFFGVPASELALLPGTSQGLNVVFQGFDWRPGDLILTADTEHDGILLPTYLACQRYGARFELLPLLSGADPLEELDAALRRKRPALFAISHVTFCTGQLLPLKEMVARCHEAGVPVLVDSAQSVGAVPVDLGELGADFTALTGHKWLLAPEGAGALHVRSEWLDRLKLGSVGWASRRSFDLEGQTHLHPTAARFEIGTKEVGVLRGWLECLRLFTHFGMDAVYGRILRLSQAMHAALSRTPGVEVALPPEQARTGLLCFRVRGVAAKEAVARLAREAGVISRFIPSPFPDWVRLSINFFQTEDELERVAEAVRRLATRS